MDAQTPRYDGYRLPREIISLAAMGFQLEGGNDGSWTS
jgi:hypothetical protein